MACFNEANRKSLFSFAVARGDSCDGMIYRRHFTAAVFNASFVDAKLFFTALPHCRLKMIHLTEMFVCCLFRRGIRCNA